MADTTSRASGSGPPPRPAPFEERGALFLLRALAPRLGRVEPDPPPAQLEPFESVALAGSPARGTGGLTATWFSAAGEARGVVVFLHPWLPWGRAYFHRRGRIPAVRAAGLHALTIDLPGFGGSASPRLLYDRAVEEALGAARARAPGLPCHVWGVSSGGYWAHPVLGRSGAEPVAGAMFEDVTPHLLEWSAHMAPQWKACYGFFRLVFPRAFRYLDVRCHAPFLAAERVAYVGGASDPGIPTADLHGLARAAGAVCREVPGAGHLESIKRAGPEVIAVALETFGVGA